MTTSYVSTQDSVLKRVLLLYGLFMLLSNAAYLLGYYLMPEGFLRGIPEQGPSGVAATGTFWSQLALTFLGNLGLLIVLSVSLNVFQVRGFPLGYLWLMATALLSGAIAGTNSFLLSDLTRINVWDGMANSLSIGGLEFLADILIVASTVSIVVYQFSSWTQLRPTKLKSFRDIRLTGAEVLCLVGGIVALFVAAYLETVLAPRL